VRSAAAAQDSGQVNVSASRGVSLAVIQQPIRSRLDDVLQTMARIVSSELPLVGQVSAHLLAMRGKMFRPTILLLSSEVEGKGEEKAVTLAASLELIHLATLVHDDAVDHSALRRGMPTVNALFSHQVSVIMGDFLYSSALTHLVALKDLEALQALTRASTEMTLGEIQQIRGALSRIESGSYGICSSCGRPIGTARLAAVPSALTCVACTR